MRVWRANVDDPDEGTLVIWAGSERQVRTEAREVIAGGSEDRPRRLSDVECLEIPTDKAGLIRWLNIYVCTDNG